MPPELINEIALGYADHQRCVSVPRAQQTLAERIAVTSALERLNILREKARNEFAASRELIVAKKAFGLDQLRRGSNVPLAHECPYPQSMGEIDHPDFFREPRSPFRPAAILSHIGSGFPQSSLQQFAAQHGLQFELLPFSWYCPTYTAALFRRHDDELLW